LQLPEDSAGGGTDGGADVIDRWGICAATVVPGASGELTAGGDAIHPWLSTLIRMKLSKISINPRKNSISPPIAQLVD
jgi:hypothetical protein